MKRTSKRQGTLKKTKDQMTRKLRLKIANRTNNKEIRKDGTEDLLRNNQERLCKIQDNQ